MLLGLLRLGWVAQTWPTARLTLRNSYFSNVILARFCLAMVYQQRLIIYSHTLRMDFVRERLVSSPVCL